MTIKGNKLAINQVLNSRYQGMTKPQSTHETWWIMFSTINPRKQRVDNGHMERESAQCMDSNTNNMCIIVNYIISAITSYSKAIMTKLKNTI